MSVMILFQNPRKCQQRCTLRPKCNVKLIVYMNIKCPKDSVLSLISYSYFNFKRKIILSEKKIRYIFKANEDFIKGLKRQT